MSQTSKKVLVVEDEQSLCDAIVAVLQKNGYEVFAASDGEQGLSSALQNHPDLILLDHLMPTKSGLSMLEELRKDDWGANVSVIMTTNVSETDNVNKALMHNVKQYVVKSDVSLEDLVLYVNQELGGNSAAPARDFAASQEG